MTPRGVEVGDWNVLYRMQNRARRGEIGESTVRRLILLELAGWLSEMCGLRGSLGPGRGSRRRRRRRISLQLVSAWNERCF